MNLVIQYPTKTTVVSPAAGPLTLKEALLINGINNPPIIPAISPDENGAPDASAIPKHRGSATKNTTNPAGKSYLRLDIKLVSVNPFF